jgi:hypothetical protein
MRIVVDDEGKSFTRYTDSERASRAARARAGKNRVAGQGHPTTSEIQYTQAELEFMRAVGEFQTRTGRKFPTWREVYRVFVELGYEKAPEGRTAIIG